MGKKKLRKLVISRRNLLSPQEIREKSLEIRKKLFEQEEFAAAKTIFSYINFGSEVRTKEIIEKCFELKKKVLVPVVIKEPNEIVASEFFGFEKLEKSSFGVPEPIQTKGFPMKKIELALVPGIAFDKNLNRLGFGKGFFDKFLARLPQATTTIALAFELQIFENIPVAKHDVKVKKIITEKRVIQTTDNI